MDVEHLLADLISIDSTNPDLGMGAGEAEIAAFVVDWLSKHGVDAWLEETEILGRPNAIGRVTGGDGPTLMLNGHLDTVGVGGQADPFTPRIEGRRMYGRGSMDTKGGVAALMVATARSVDAGISGTVLFTGVADEEYASVGTAAIAVNHQADAAIVTEPSRLEIVIAHRGFEWFEIETTGIAAHGSLPEVGVDAIAKMGRVLVSIEDLGRKLALGDQHPLLGSGSIHASVISGGQEPSSYPSQCVLAVERRTVPGEATEAMTKELQNLLDAISRDDPQFSAVLRHTLSRPPYEIDSETPIVQMVCRSTERVTGGPPTIAGHAAWMDTAILGAAGIPSVVLGPVGEGLHADVEWVDLDSVGHVSDIVYEVIREFCV
jgi:acetylornithine deacetylase